jgi:hypothetical protein
MKTPATWRGQPAQSRDFVRPALMRGSSNRRKARCSYSVACRIPIRLSIVTRGCPLLRVTDTYRPRGRSSGLIIFLDFKKDTDAPATNVFQFKRPALHRDGHNPLPHLSLVDGAGLGAVARYALVRARGIPARNVPGCMVLRRSAKVAPHRERRRLSRRSDGPRWPHAVRLRGVRHLVAPIQLEGPSRMGLTAYLLADAFARSAASVFAAPSCAAFAR